MNWLMNVFPIVPAPPISFHIPGLVGMNELHCIVAPILAAVIAGCGTFLIAIAGTYNPRNSTPAFTAYTKQMVRDGLRTYPIALILLMFGSYALALMIGAVTLYFLRGFFRGIKLALARG